MIQFTFSDISGVLSKITVLLQPGMTGGEAFEVAAHQFRAVYGHWTPGNPDITITMRGV